MAKDADGDEKEGTPAADQEKKEEKKPAMAQKKADPKANATKPALAQKKADPHANKTKPAVAQKKKVVKTEEDEIPMDTAAIKAYSSVIADAAEDSEPQTPVQYEQVAQVEEKPAHEVLGLDPMGSMIQNEITSIKQASIQAAQDHADD